MWKYFEDVIDLSEHNMNDVCGYGCEPCGAYYRYEKYLKIHLDKLNVVMSSCLKQY